MRRLVKSNGNTECKERSFKLYRADQHNSQRDCISQMCCLAIPRRVRGGWSPRPRMLISASYGANGEITIADVVTQRLRLGSVDIGTPSMMSARISLPFSGSRPML
mmetsp:Transcript_32466/g.103203  ORF Transcript_32466/g.103203 Transcript_32466/m.103203 type:complete len:106 (+) Transcript_32466:450-767(+)